MFRFFMKGACRGVPFTAKKGKVPPAPIAPALSRFVLRNPTSTCYCKHADWTLALCPTCVVPHARVPPAHAFAAQPLSTKTVRGTKAIRRSVS